MLKYETRMRPICRSANWLVAFTMILTLGTSFHAEAQSNQRWVELFKPNALPKNWTTTGNWRIDDKGLAALTPRPGEHGWKRFDAYLWSNQQYGDFEADFDYQVRNEGNSGFFLHVGDKASPVEHGIEVQIFDSYGQAVAQLTDHDSGGVIPGFPPVKNAARVAGEWNHFHIVVKGNRLDVELNGAKVNEAKLDSAPLKDRPKKGYIGFQDEGHPLLLRYLRIREFN
jgi:hypothetical protein